MLHAAWSDGPSDPEKETTLHMVLQRATRVYKGGVWVDTVFEYACPSACLVHRPPEFFSTYLFETISNSPCRFVALPMFQICKSDINAARCFPFTVIDQIYTHAEAHIECIGFGNKQCPLFVDYLDGSGSLDSIQQRAYVKYSKRPISGLNVVLYDDDMSLETGYPMQLLIWGVGLKLSDLKKLIPKTAQNHLSHRPG